MYSSAAVSCSNRSYPSLFCLFLAFFCLQCIWLKFSCCLVITVVPHCRQAIEFADDQTKRIYDEAFQLFKSSNRSRDEQVDFSVDYHLPSYVKELAIPDPNKRWMSSNYFVLATCLCLTWPYRWLLSSSKSEYHYRVVKKVEVGPTHSQPTVPAGHPIPIGISKGEGQPLLDLAPVNPPPITPPPPYEA